MTGTMPHPGPACYIAPMSAEFDPRTFYATPLGAVAARQIRRALADLSPARPGDAVLGIGHPQPYLRHWRGAASRRVAAIPVRPGDPPPGPWPRGGRSLTCAIGPGDRLPFPDFAFDRVLLVHGLERAGDARVLLRDIWRVLRDDGRVIVVAPNRTGLWAHVEGTPFGHGEPYSAGQIGRLLDRALFRVTGQRRALFVPPARSRLLLRTAPVLETLGARYAETLAGVTLTEASKEVLGIMPKAAIARRRMVLIERAA